MRASLLILVATGSLALLAGCDVAGEIMDTQAGQERLDDCARRFVDAAKAAGVDPKNPDNESMILVGVAECMQETGEYRCNFREEAVDFECMGTGDGVQAIYSVKAAIKSAIS